MIVNYDPLFLAREACSAWEAVGQIDYDRELTRALTASLVREGVLFDLSSVLEADSNTVL